MANNNNNNGMITMSKSEIENLVKESVQELEEIFCRAACMFKDMTDVSIFYNLSGFRRKFEYKHMCFMMLSKKLHRIAIENLNVPILPITDYKKVDIIPRNLLDTDRLDAGTESNVRSQVKDIYDKWLNMEYEMAEEYKNMWFKLLSVEDCNTLTLSCFVKCLYDETISKIKYLERCIIDYQSTGYNTMYIKMQDHKMHKHYKKKLGKLSKIMSKYK